MNYAMSDFKSMNKNNLKFLKNEIICTFGMGFPVLILILAELGF